MAVGLALTAGSMFMQAQAQRKVEKKRRKVTEAEAERQREYQARADERLSQAMRGMGAEEQRRAMDEAAAERTAAIQEQATVQEGDVPTEYVPTAPGGPKYVQEEAAKTFSKRLKAGKEEAKRLGALGSWGQALQGAQTGLLRSGQDINRLSGFMRGSQAVLPAELAAANQAGQGLAQIGDVMGLAGSVLTRGAMTAPARRPIAGAGPAVRGGTLYTPGAQGFYTALPRPR